MGSSVDALVAALKQALPGFSVTLSDAAREGHAAIEARNASGTGVDVDVILADAQASVSFASKARFRVMMAALALTVVLTYLFGWDVLAAMGLVADIGTSSVTIKALFVVPLLVFLIPTMIAASVVGKMISPADQTLLKTASECAVNAGFSVES